MLDRIVEKLRLGVTIVVLGLSAAMLAGPGILQPQAAPSEEPCAFEDENDEEWVCVEGAHLYKGQCEGIDCYSAQEFCCLEPIIVQ